MGVFNNALQFALSTVFDMLISLFVLRVILQYFAVYPRNQVVQFVGKMTTPVVMPLRKIIPNIVGIDVAASLIAWLLAMLKAAILVALLFGVIPSIFWLIPHGLGDVINAVLNIFMYSIIILVVMSWISPAGNNPALDVLHAITAPILEPARRRIPTVGGFDLSPMVVIFIIMLLRIVLVGPLLAM